MGISQPTSQHTAEHQKKMAGTPCSPLRKPGSAGLTAEPGKKLHGPQKSFLVSHRAGQLGPLWGQPSPHSSWLEQLA